MSRNSFYSILSLLCIFLIVFSITMALRNSSNESINSNNSNVNNDELPSNYELIEKFSVGGGFIYVFTYKGQEYMYTYNGYITPISIVPVSPQQEPDHEN